MYTDFDELTGQKLKDVMYLVKGNLVFLGIDYRVIGGLYRRFSEQRYSAHWITVDSRSKKAFIKWCITSPLDGILEECNRKE